MEKKDMFHYIYLGNSLNFTINTKGFFKDINEIDYSIIEQAPNLIHSRSIYPNGVILETKQTSESIEMWTSHRLVVSPTFEIVFDIEYPRSI